MTQTSIDKVIETSTIEQLKAIIRGAEEAIEQKKASEIQAIRERMVHMASQVDMTPEDLLAYATRKRRTTGKPKFRNPQDPTQTWTGHGKKPGWFKQAIENGTSPDAMRIPD